MAESSNHFNSSLLCHFFKARQLLPSVDGRRSDFYSPINPSIKTQMPATDITAVCQCTVSMATDFVQNLLCCAALCFPFQRCPHTRGTHHSSHRAEWLKPQRDSWNCFFLAEANSDLWEKREDGDQPGDGAEWSKGRRCAVLWLSGQFACVSAAALKLQRCFLAQAWAYSSTLTSLTMGQ